MKTQTAPIAFFLSCTLFLFSGQVISAKLYKWVDESGNVSFSDQVPPDEAKYRRETLNKRGAVVDVTEQEKTREQQLRDEQLNLLRKKQERVIESQKAHDDALLRSYHSKEEMLTELKEKIQAMEAQRKLMEVDVAQQLGRLDAKQKSAATFERNGKPTPANLIEEIRVIHSEIDRAKQTLDKNLAVQQKTTDEYNVNIKRFLALTHLDEPNQQHKIPSIEEADALGLFRCENDFQCQQAWEIARVFVDTYSTTKPDVVTDQLIMHTLPTKNNDFSLSISKITSKDSDNQLFLDIHCHESSQGKELCASAKIQALRTSFRSYVNERLNNNVPTP